MLHAKWPGDIRRMLKPQCLAKDIMAEHANGIRSVAFSEVIPMSCMLRDPLPIFRNAPMHSAVYKISNPPKRPTPTKAKSNRRAKCTVQ